MTIELFNLWEESIWFRLLIVWALFILVAYSLKRVDNWIVNSISNSTHNQYQLIKKTSFFIIVAALLALVLTQWVNQKMNELKLLSEGITTSGVISEAIQDSESIETDAGQKGTKYFYYISFNFRTETGEVIESHSSVDGTVPVSLTNLQDKPYPVKVQYLASNPSFNRVIGFNDGHENVNEWLKEFLLITLVIIVVSSIIGYYSFQSIKHRGTKGSKSAKITQSE